MLSKLLSSLDTFTSLFSTDNSVVSVCFDHRTQVPKVSFFTSSLKAAVNSPRDLRLPEQTFALYTVKLVTVKYSI